MAAQPGGGLRCCLEQTPHLSVVLLREGPSLAGLSGVLSLVPNCL